MKELTEVTIAGWISIHDHGESEDILHLSCIEEPLADFLEFMHRKNVTVRYWVTDTECSIDQASEDFLATVMGRAEVKYGAQYSELTGYLWTDEDLIVGGHDLLKELKSYKDKWLILQLEINE